MKKILDSRRLLGATPKSDLKELGSLYKGLMKTHHPDKFTDEAEKHEAEAMSTRIIDAYHFLVSIAPETHELNKDEYEKLTTSSPISNWHYKAQVLQVYFADGTEYEYFNVPQNVYNKFVNNDANLRFARRHIFHVFPRRRVKKASAQ
jgi:curved DNA-binding protein CbpA